MLFSLALIAAGAAGGAAAEPQPYWLNCAKGMETTVSAAAVGHLTGTVDETRLVSGMNHATSCTTKALELPPDIRNIYQAMLLSFMAALESSAPSALDSFSEARVQFTTAIEASSLPATYTLSASDSDQLISEAKTEVEKDLRDPMSAQYRNVRVLPGQMTVVCGEVNAKNAYGGYVGFRRFLSTAEATILEDTGAQYALRNVQDQIFSSLCPEN